MAKKSKNSLWNLAVLPRDERAFELAARLGIVFEKPVDDFEWLLLWGAIGKKLAEKELGRRGRGRPDIWTKKKLDLVLDMLKVHKDWTKPPSAPVLAERLSRLMPEKYGIYAGKRIPTLAKYVLPWKRFTIRLSQIILERLEGRISLDEVSDRAGAIDFPKRKKTSI